MAREDVTAVLRGDARAIPLRDESVDLIVTSPPYFGQRSYRDDGEHFDGQLGSEPHPREFLEALWAVTAECWRVLKPSGSMFVNLGDKRSGSGAPGTTTGLSTLRGSKQQTRTGRVQGDRSGMTGSMGQRHLSRDPERNVRAPNRAQYIKAAFGRAKSKQLLPHRYAIGCEDGLADPDRIGWIVRQDLVWDKPNGMPESVKDRTRDAHEFWFHLCKQGDYFAALDGIREPHAAGTAERYEAGYGDRSKYNDERIAIGQDLGGDWLLNPRGKVPSSVWRIPTQPFSAPASLGVDHFAAFPPEWPRRLILAFSPPAGVVLDPFGGSGTTAMVARSLGRTGISIDLSADYCRLAQWRVFESNGAAKVADRTAGERQQVLL